MLFDRPAPAPCVLTLVAATARCHLALPCSVLAYPALAHSLPSIAADLTVCNTAQAALLEGTGQAIANLLYAGEILTLRRDRTLFAAGVPPRGAVLIYTVRAAGARRPAAAAAAGLLQRAQALASGPVAGSPGAGRQVGGTGRDLGITRCQMCNEKLPPLATALAVLPHPLSQPTHPPPHTHARTHPRTQQPVPAAGHSQLLPWCSPQPIALRRSEVPLTLPLSAVPLCPSFLRPTP